MEFTKRTITIYGQSEHRKGFAVVEIVTDEKYFDVYHVKTSNLVTPTGEQINVPDVIGCTFDVIDIKWGIGRNHKFYIKSITA